METTTALWQVQAVDGSTSSKSCPALEGPCCQGFEVLRHPRDGEFGDGHVPDQAWADPVAVEMQLLLASKEGLIDLLEHGFQLQQKSTSLLCCGVRGGDG